jgi:hypothetical protein
MLTPVFLDLSDGEVIGEPAPASPQDRMRLRPLPPPVPADHRLPPRVVEVPVEPGQGQVTVRGGAPAMVEGSDQGSSNPSEPRGTGARPGPATD